MDENLTLLTRVNAKEILAAFKIDRLGRFQPLAEWLASFPARRLSRQILRFDDLVGKHGLAAAGRYILDDFTCSTHIEGQQHVPRCGPLLGVANHPGMVDAMAIWVALEHRPDLKIIASERELLQLIPNIRSRLLFVDPSKGKSITTAARRSKPSATRWGLAHLPSRNDRTGPVGTGCGFARRLVG